MLDGIEAQKRASICDVALPVNVDCEGNIIPPPQENGTPGLEHVPAEKLKEMQEYAKMLRKKFPHMKEKRLGKKVAEHFKIKLT